jgi:hypothetical protein
LIHLHGINGLQPGEHRMAPETNAATPQTLPLVSRVMDKTLSYVVAVLLVAMSGTVFGNVTPRLVADICDYGAFEITRRY